MVRFESGERRGLSRSQVSALASATLGRRRCRSPQELDRLQQIVSAIEHPLDVPLPAGQASRAALLRRIEDNRHHGDDTATPLVSGQLRRVRLPGGRIRDDGATGDLPVQPRT